MLFASSRELIVPLAGARLGLSVSEVAIASALGFVVDSVFSPSPTPSLPPSFACSEFDYAAALMSTLLR